MHTCIYIRCNYLASYMAVATWLAKPEAGQPKLIAVVSYSYSQLATYISLNIHV